MHNRNVTNELEWSGGIWTGDVIDPELDASRVMTSDGPCVQSEDDKRRGDSGLIVSSAIS